MSRFVIDFQAYNYDRSYIIKELCIINLDTNHVLHFLARPPFDRSVLSSDEEKRVSWLENYFHKIKWEDGADEYSDVFASLRQCVRNAKILYVKGRERALFIQHVTGKFTMDLDQLDCPPASSLPALNSCCHYYTHSNSPHSKCALYQALKFKDWLSAFASDDCK